MQISVITAVFNRVGTTREAMGSVQRQGYPQVEHVIQDGKSSDGTLEEIAALSNGAKRLVSDQDHGIYGAINRGISRASGDIIGLMHSDDFFADDRVLEKAASRFADPQVEGVYGDLQYVSASNSTKIVRQWPSGDYEPSRLSRGWMPPHALSTPRGVRAPRAL